MHDPTPGHARRFIARLPVWARIACVVLSIGLLVAFVRFVADDSRPSLIAEDGPIENAQLIAWLCSAIVCVVCCVRGPLRDDRLLWCWRGFLALLIAARELDLHEKLNSDVVGRLGVSYRIDWWLDETVPLWLRAGWGFFGIAAVVLLVAPPLLVRPPTFRMLRAGEITTWLFVSAFGMLFIGYAFDDLLGRGTIIESIHTTQTIEELAELVGAAAYLGSCVTGLREPYTARKARMLSDS
jgi:hypothetical protein